ncbi:hypothetical protein MJO28_010890 [Puccinia striiformis f. sp. tritici]|uniref:Uncharacterized protein n=1 Tax=Puccinia striiformis f. sp. tritici TaxID=168172 RepID=A0ACC0E5S1_9BASI|nr:hypothetical protein MJO28_010890 [Puccinia striiformis f. sp. tritici]
MAHPHPAPSTSAPTDKLLLSQSQPLLLHQATPHQSAESCDQEDTRQPKPKPDHPCRHRSGSHLNQPFSSPPKSYSAHVPSQPWPPAPRAHCSFLSRLLRNPLRRTQRTPFLPTSTSSIAPSGTLARSAPSRLHQAGIGFLLLLAGVSSYLLLVSLLDHPNSLELDPTIDPVTLQLCPLGDPLKLNDPVQQQPSRASVALSQSNRERESGFSLRMQHAIHHNITSLNATSITQALKFAQEHLAQDDAQASKIPRKWYMPDQALIQNRPASRFSCQSTSPTLIFLAIFTTPSGFEKRNLIRTLIKSDLPPNSLIELKFISGQPENENWTELLKIEQSLHHDLVVLKDLEDNIDRGKTFEFFKWIAQREKRRQDIITSDSSLPTSHQFLDEAALDGWPESSSDSSVDDRDPRKVAYGKPKFVIKSDDDTFLVIPNLLKVFKDLDCQKNIYWGTSQGASKIFDAYFRGLGYGLSWPLVEWIGTSNMSLESQVGIEDARVGAWLTDLNPLEDPLIRIDEGWKMADWNQVEIDKDVIGLHWLKKTEWFPMIRLKVLKVWEAAHQPYRWDYFM